MTAQGRFDKTPLRIEIVVTSKEKRKAGNYPMCNPKAKANKQADDEENLTQILRYCAMFANYRSMKF